MQNKSIDHYYTASLLGKGFGTLSLDEKGKKRGGRYWNVSVLNTQKLLSDFKNFKEQSPLEDIDLISKFFDTCSADYFELKEADLLFSSSSLTEPDNDKIQTKESQLNEYIDTSTYNIRNTDKSSILIYSLVKETFIKSPLVNDYSHSEYNSQSKQTLEEDFNSLIGNENITIKNFTIDSGPGFLVDSVPIILLAKEFWESCRGLKHFEVEFSALDKLLNTNILVWFYKKNNMYLICKNEDYCEKSLMQLLNNSLFYTFLYWHFSSKAVKYIVCDANNDNFAYHFLCHYEKNSFFRVNREKIVLLSNNTLHPKSDYVKK